MKAGFSYVHMIGLAGAEQPRAEHLRVPLCLDVRPAEAIRTGLSVLKKATIEAGLAPSLDKVSMV